jgi:electron transfer flavoprotein beta subunit
MGTSILTFILSSLNTPRFATLPNIMKAKKKPIEKLAPKDLGIDIKPTLTTVSVAEPPARVGGGKVKSVDEVFLNR